MPKALLLLALVASAQAQDRVSQKEPITLPGFESGVSAEQKAVQALIQKGATEYRAGDYKSAIRTFQDALQKLRRVPQMKGDEDSLLVRLGQAYIGARRLDDALDTFSLLLSPRTVDCRPDVTAVEYCADAQYYIGFTHMQKGNFDQATSFLKNSMASYARAASGSEFIEYTMIKLKQQAETETLLAAALLRTGHKQSAIESLNHAISQLSMVEANEQIQDAIRTSARKSLKDARSALDMVAKN